ncbi:HAD family hydrolase [Methanobrevibacter sp.]|uniref:HAD family hydrolase n=1 Tax=Methanobrevibacter sp. TaxID=66852 RepID=UPI0025D96A61|nr:HAD family hydrolase [Methanobrevibacter sp.]MBQ2832243.1 HAD family hydrolase [Methanobrevibacter sp.]
MKKLAIFDFDGTLFDSICDVVICFNRVLEIYGFPTMTREEYIPCLGGNIDEIVSLVLGENSTPQNVEEVKETYLDFYNSSKKDLTVPFPDSLDLLENLQDRNILLAINSNRLNYSLNEFVERHFSGIDFTAIEGHSYPNPSKPNPYGVNRVLEKAGVDADEAIYIGDSATDIKTAENAGIDCILVRWGYGNQKDFENPHVLGVVDDMSEIIKYF